MLPHQFYRFTAWILLVLASSGLVYAQAIIYPNLPDCAEPFTTQLLEVVAELELPTDSLKVYDVRILFDTTKVVPDMSQIQQGAWFPAAGPTFFWRDYEDGLLIVNGAVLGPDLAVTGTGVLFSVPVELLDVGFTTLDYTYTELWDAQALPLPHVGAPGTIQAPCTDIHVNILYDSVLEQVELTWDAQDPTWVTGYKVYGSDSAWSGWYLLESTDNNFWLDSVVEPRKYYRVRAVLGVD